MSITTKIQRINGGKNAIRTLASRKNVNIPSTALIDSYASILGAQWPDCTLNVNYDGDKIRGKTMKWNQMISSLKPSGVYNGITINSDGREMEITGTSTGSVNAIVTEPAYIKVEVGHKYLVSGMMGNGSTSTYRNKMSTYEGSSWKSDSFFDDSYFIISPNHTLVQFLIYTYLSGVTINQKIKPNLTDLTDIFGAGNEPSSTSDPRVPFLIQYAKDHPDYDAGSLVYSFYKGTKLGEYDYIDTTNNKLVLDGAEVDISQMALTRFLFGSNYLFYGTNNDQETNTTNVISADYQTAGDITDIPDMSVTGNGGTGKTLWFRDDSCTTVEQFKAKNAGKKVYFKLATPTEIDL